MKNSWEANACTHAKLLMHVEVLTCVAPIGILSEVKWSHHTPASFLDCL
jgi:hypothetical protein